MTDTVQLAQIREQAATALSELLEQTHYRPGDIVVIVLSSS